MMGIFIYIGVMLCVIAYIVFMTRATGEAKRIGAIVGGSIAIVATISFVVIVQVTSGWRHGAGRTLVHCTSDRNCENQLKCADGRCDEECGICEFKAKGGSDCVCFEGERKVDARCQEPGVAPSNTDCSSFNGPGGMVCHINLVNGVDKASWECDPRACTASDCVGAVAKTCAPEGFWASSQDCNSLNQDCSGGACRAKASPICTEASCPDGTSEISACENGVLGPPVPCNKGTCCGNRCSECAAADTRCCSAISRQECSTCAWKTTFCGDHQICRNGACDDTPCPSNTVYCPAIDDCVKSCGPCEALKLHPNPHCVSLCDSDHVCRGGSCCRDLGGVIGQCSSPLILDECAPPPCN